MKSTSNYWLRREGAGWFTLGWRENIIHHYTVASALRDVAEVPGVVIYPKAVNIARTALRTEPVRELLEVCNVCCIESTSTIAPWFHPSLMEHQKSAVEKMLLNGGRGLLADIPGLGKSRVAISIALSVRRFYDYKRPCVVLAKKYLRRTWLNELVICGVSEESICTLESRDMDDVSFEEDAAFYFVNPEIIKFWWSKLLLQRPCMAIVDEAHHYKDLRTQRAKGALMVSTAPHALFLTGTPMSDRPQDLWSLLTMITGPKSWGTAVDFIKRYAGAEYNGHGFVPVSVTNEKELFERIEPWYLRRTLEDAGVKMPPLTRTIIEASWEDAKLGIQVQRNHDKTIRNSYAQIAQALKEGRIHHDVLEILSQLRSQTSAAKVQTTVDYVRELQVSSQGVGSISLGTTAGTNEEALSQLASFSRAVFGAVVFTWTKAAATEISEKLRNGVVGVGAIRQVFCITGDVPQLTRDQYVEEFQQTGGVLVATYATLSEGVTLTRARFVVLHDLGWTPAEIEQAEKRVHRIGQNVSCLSTWVVLRNSIDEIFARVLEWKLRLNQGLLSIENEDLREAAQGIARQKSFEEELEASLAAWKG